METAQGRVRRLAEILRSTSFLVRHYVDDGHALPELAELKASLDRAVSVLETYAVNLMEDEPASAH